MLGPVEVCFPSEGVARWVRWQWVGGGSSLLEAKEREMGGGSWRETGKGENI